MKVIPPPPFFCTWAREKCSAAFQILTRSEKLTLALRKFGLVHIFNPIEVRRM